MNNKTEREILITKASGEQEFFSSEKLKKSLEKVGASSILVEGIISHIKKEIKDGAKTEDIYRSAFAILRKRHRLSADRYSLKKAIMDLGPSGHPFEKFVGELLKTQGFSVEIGKIVVGSCVSHEIDIIGKKDNRHIMVECKFHNQPGIKSDVQTALYVQARFEDIKKQWEAQPNHNQKFYEVWLVTNTKITTDAIQYATCVNMKAIGWSYPFGKGLQYLIEESGLHPLTCLTLLSRFQKQQLLGQGFVLCRDIVQNKSALELVGLNKIKAARVFEEINQLC